MSAVKSYSEKWRSPNYGERADGVKPGLVILHYTNMKTAEEALQRLCDPASEVSAHYLIDEDGSIYQLVDESFRAWHAGQSYWQAETDINSHSIGIELVNPGHAHGYQPFTLDQIETLMALCWDIQSRNTIRSVLGHSDIAPDRPDKIDPGHLFPWERLAKEGIGQWPDAEEGDLKNVKQRLVDVGYNPACDEATLLAAFQRHYVPEAFENGTEGQMDDTTRARLLGLHKLTTS